MNCGYCGYPRLNKKWIYLFEWRNCYNFGYSRVKMRLVIDMLNNKDIS